MVLIANYFQDKMKILFNTAQTKSNKSQKSLHDGIYLQKH